MIEETKTIHYDVTITTDVETKCSEIDPIGTCTVTDCMTCKNARVQIVREDGVVMRDDNETGKNAGYEENLSYIKYKYKENPAEFMESVLDIKLSKWQKRILKAAKKYDAL